MSSNTGKKGNGLPILGVKLSAEVIKKDIFSRNGIFGQPVSRSRRLHKDPDSDSEAVNYSNQSRNEKINSEIKKKLTKSQMSQSQDSESVRPQRKPVQKKCKQINKIESLLPLFGIYDEEESYDPEQEHSLVDLQDGTDQLRTILQKFAAQCEGSTIEKINKEFAELPPVPKEKECAEFVKNRKRNRYQDVYCLSSTRVKLDFLSVEVGGNDYIHANRIEYPTLQTKYILTQGPRKNTVIDFWRMIWQENTTAIIMLCRLIESDKPKCSEYFPQTSGPVLSLGNGLLKVENVSQTTYDSVVTTQLKLIYLGMERLITHYQWTEWPDYSVPDETKSETIFKLLKNVRGRKTPVVIHCSAGIGRSGTLLAIEMCLMDCLHAEVPQVPRIVRLLRLNGRSQAIQSVLQYMAVRKVVLDFGLKHRLIEAKDFASYTKMYEKSVQIAQSLWK